MKSDNKDNKDNKDDKDDKGKYRVYVVLIAASIYAIGYHVGRSRAWDQVFKLCAK